MSEAQEKIRLIIDEMVVGNIEMREKMLLIESMLIDTTFPEEFYED